MITVVMEVPALQMQMMTNMLRHAPNYRSTNTYLSLASSGADPASQMREDAVALESRIDVLEAILHTALGALDVRSPAQAEVLRRELACAPKAKHATIKNELAKLRAAVHERKADVAAHLLASIKTDADY